MDADNVAGPEETICRLVQELKDRSDQLAAAQAENAELTRIAETAHKLWLEAEEYDFPDGLGQGAEQYLWDGLADALEPWSERAALAPAEKGEVK